MRGFRKLMLLLALAVVLVLALVVPAMAAGPTTGSGVEPVLIDPWTSGNAEFEMEAIGLDGCAYKVEPWDEGDPSGSYVYGDNTITITAYLDGDEYKTFDWTSEQPVLAVIVKAAGAALVYWYMPDGAYEDTGLWAPYNKGISHATFAWECGDDEYNGAISAAKWYDRDMDGYWDGDEPALAGWKINLTDGTSSWCALTDATGYVTFAGLAPGTYYLSEEPAPCGSCWVQTWPSSNLYEVELGPDEFKSGYEFGNVCQVFTTGGYTLGYWSNKNGQASLGSGWQSYLNGYNLVKADGNAFVADKYNDFRNWLLRADAVNMSYMLSVQFAAKLLNEAYKGTSYAGYGVVYNGEYVSIDDLQGAADAFLAANPLTVAYGPERAEAEFYKCVFDGLNNNSLLVIPYDPCPVPTFSCE